MDKEKLIEAMAIADYYDGSTRLALWETLPKAEKEVYRGAARRMLKALCKELPDGGECPKICHYCTGAASNNYNELKQWGNDE